MRSDGSSRGQGPSSNAWRAAPTAASTSAGPAAATCATGASVAGEITSITASVLGFDQLPLINSSPARTPTSGIISTTCDCSAEHIRSAYVSFSQATGRQLDRALPRSRHRAGVLRGLHLPGVLRARAGGDLQASLAQCRSRRATSTQRQLLHQGTEGCQPLDNRA